MLHSLEHALQICVLELGDAYECYNDYQIFDRISIDVPGTVSKNCSSKDVCFQTKHWSYEGDGESFYAYPTEGSTMNNNLELYIGLGDNNIGCEDDRGESSGKTYEGMCRVLNL